MLPIRLLSSARIIRLSNIHSLHGHRVFVVSVVVLGVTGHVSKHGPRSIA